MLKTVTALSLLVGGYIAEIRDDGRYAQSPLKSWFDSLKSEFGACCSDADGNVVKDADWESHNGKYRVRIGDQWYDVPDGAVLKQPNLYQKTMVWPLYGPSGMTIRCFIPGPMI